MPSPSPQVPAISAPQVSVGHSQHPNPTSHMLSILNMNSNLNNPHNAQLSSALTSGNTGLSLVFRSTKSTYCLANTPGSLLQQPQNPFNHLNPGTQFDDINLPARGEKLVVSIRFFSKPRFFRREIFGRLESHLKNYPLQHFDFVMTIGCQEKSSP